MNVEFVDRENGPDRLLCDAEVTFGPGDGELAGMKLVGFALWKGPDGDIYVTFPSRSFGLGQERRYYDYLRSTDGQLEVARRVKVWIVDCYRRRRVAA